MYKLTNHKQHILQSMVKIIDFIIFTLKFSCFHCTVMQLTDGKCFFKESEAFLD